MDDNISDLSPTETIEQELLDKLDTFQNILILKSFMKVT